uniref:TetR/AcrR family transcriptional regulator n=1 Tax=Propionicimonas sp. TaxID=1955623 RepID=UPI0039E2E00B
MDETPGRPAAGRTARKREAILTAATGLFLRNGFHGTSMDEVASLAQVSKQTVYKQFADKEALFREIVEGVTGNSDAVVDLVTTAFGKAPATSRADLEERLRAVARAHLDAVLRPEVLSLRRLIIAEAEQFPDLARRYYEQAPSRGVDVVADCLRTYVDAGLVDADDLRLAAGHFAYLALAAVQDRALFIPTELPDRKERDRIAAAAARAFLAAHGTNRTEG